MRHDLTALGYSEQVDALRVFLKNKDDFLDYNFNGSVISLLLELLSYNSYNSAFNINMLSNESYLETAELRENILRKARELGYLPHSVVASFVDLSFVLDINAPSSNIVLKKGTGVQTVYNQVPYSFVALEDIPATQNNEGNFEFNNVRLYEGTLLTDNYIFFNNRSQRFIIENRNIDVSKIKVKVGNETEGYQYYRVHSNLLDNTPDTPIYYIDELSSDRYEITFPDGVIGKRPNSSDDIEISYLVTNGPSANGATVFNFNGIVEPSPTIVPRVSIVAEAIGGASEESDEQIKRNAPRLYSDQNRAITINDYRSLVNRLWKEKAHVVVYSGLDKDPPMPGFVFVSIRGNNPITSQEKKNLIDELKKYTVDNTQVKIVDPSKLIVEFTIKVTYPRENTVLSRDKIIMSIKNELNRYVEQNSIENFGNTLLYNKVISVVDSTQSFFHHISGKVKISKEFYPLIQRNSYYEICYQNKLLPGTISSTPFRVLSHYTTDVFLSDDSKGNLRLVDINKRILERDVGTVDYQKGEVILEDLVIIDSQSKIKVTATPSEKNVYTYREAYLDVSVDTSNFNIEWL